MFNKIKLKSITRKIGSGATPRGGKNAYKDDGISLIRSLNVYDFCFDYKDLAHIDDNQAKQLEGVTVEKGDILLNITGASVARCCIVPNNVLPARVNQHVSIIRINKEKANSCYVLYFINSPINKQKILALAQGGATREALTKEKIENFEVSLPEISIQKKVVSILFTYDDLIENNTRRIQILEEMAQRIYQEWFVHFRFPGHEKVKFVDSEMGKIPQGWQVKRIGEVLKYHIGGGWGKDVGEGKYCVTAYVIRGTDIPDVRKNNIADCPLRYHTASNYKSRKIESGDVIFEVSGGSKDQPVGRAVLINQNILCSFDQPVICASFCKLMRVNREIISPELFYLKLLSIYDDRSIYKYQVQSTGISNFKFEYFLNNEMIVRPAIEVQEEFGKIIEPIFNEIALFGQKNMKLREARDILLPKLISGELDVSDLDIVIREQENDT